MVAAGLPQPHHIVSMRGREISMMPEGLVKISSNLYETILPMVRAQVESQIKVKDLGKCAIPGMMCPLPRLENPHEIATSDAGST